MKLCALIVGTHGQAATSSQTFSLPLKSLSPTAKVRIRVFLGGGM